MTVGQNVKHDTYGNGKVVSIISRKFNDDLVVVMFDNGKRIKFTKDSPKLKDF